MKLRLLPAAERDLEIGAHRLTTSNLRSKRCPKCGGELKIVGGGFYDGIVPNPWELLVYLLTIALGYSVLTLYRLTIASG